MPRTNFKLGGSATERSVGGKEIWEVAASAHMKTVSQY